MRNNEYLSSFFSSVHQPVVVIDGNILVYANPAAEEAFDSELQGFEAKNLIPPEVLENKAENFVCAFNFLGKESAVSVVRSEGLTLLFFDPIKNAKPALFLTRSIISNLRNNAMGIKMSADRCFSMLEEGKTPPERHISILYHYYYRLLRTLTQVDSADLIERGELVFSPAYTDLVKLCSELVATASSLASETGVKISFSSDETDAVALVDPERIEQLLTNLIANSLQNCKAGNSINLSLRRSGGRIVISAEDDGAGMSQEVLSKIFALPDTELDLENFQEGNGLGLYIAYGIAQLHKGVLLVESREGEGTHVHLMLPIGEDAPIKLNTPETAYRSNNVSSVLTGLSDVLKSSSFGTKFED
ncbi:MAG: PAS domain-containing protein [Clostridiales bacterium]|nr:PAS domain-containing protein [Clostridiales bacterium]